MSVARHHYANFKLFSFRCKGSHIRAVVQCNLTFYRFVPGDALWNLAISINVYLTLFKKYSAHDLKAIEWRYMLMAYGGPFVIAFIFLFVETKERGKIYGPAVVRKPLRGKGGFTADSEC